MPWTGPSSAYEQNKYCKGSCGEDSRPSDCVMGIEDYANGELLICDPCKQEVFEQLDLYYCEGE